MIHTSLDFKKHSLTVDSQMRVGEAALAGLASQEDALLLGCSLSPILEASSARRSTSNKPPCTQQPQMLQFGCMWSTLSTGT